AGVARHGAAAARHVETNAYMVYTDGLDDIVHMLGPFVGGWDQGLEFGDLLPAAAHPPRIAELPVEHPDVLPRVARPPRLARLVAHHMRQRVVGLPHLGRMLRHPLAEALADHRRAAMDTDHSALTRQQFQHLVGHADARHRLDRDLAADHWDFA